MGHKITFTVGKDGSIEAELTGVKGQGCKAIMEKAKNAIGLEIEDDQATDDFYAIAEQTEGQNVES